jgi:hypothetical protein
VQVVRAAIEQGSPPDGLEGTDFASQGGKKEKKNRSEVIFNECYADKGCTKYF